MKKTLKRFLALILCLIIVAFTLPFAEAAQPVRVFETYTLPSYLSPVDAQITAGDINGDSSVDFLDLYRLIDYILDFDIDYVETTIDVNGDKEENVKDAVRLYNYLSGVEIEIFPKASEEPTEEISLLSYNSLTSAQKGIYNALDEGVKNLDTTISVKDFITLETYKSDIWAAYNALCWDRPEYFWLPRSYGLSGSVNSTSGELVAFYISFENLYDINATQKEELRAEVEAVVNNVVAAANEFDTDFEKELFVHDYLCANICYNYGETQLSDYTVYGALINGMCVCEGYSRAMQLICKRLGIPCSLVTGNAGGPHMWNIIEIEGETYYVDVTHDDVEQYPFNIEAMHAYFNVNKTLLLKTRDFNPIFDAAAEYAGSEEFNFFETDNENTDYNYYHYTGGYVGLDGDLTSVTEYMKDLFDKGYTEFEIGYEEGVDYAAFFEQLYPAIVGYIPDLFAAYYPFEDCNMILSFIQL